MEKIYDVRNLKVTSRAITFSIGREIISVPMEKTGSKLLPEADFRQLTFFEIDRDGIGIHWPGLDEDLSVSGLLRSAGRKELVVQKIPSIYWKESLETSM